MVFGGAGSIGAAAAKEFASEGAEVFLAGRTRACVETAAKQIVVAGGWAHADVVDALDAAAVEEYLESVVAQAGGLDIEFNATGPRASEYASGKRAADLPVAEFMVPVDTVLKAQFITASAAAGQMLKQGSGVIIFLTGSPARPHTPGASGIGAAFGAVENLTRQMAIELSPPACEWSACGPRQIPTRALSRT